MPSNAMVTYKATFYLEQSDQIEGIMSEHDLKTARFIRECCTLIMEDNDLLQIVIRECKKISYRKTGANIGVWKQVAKKRREKQKGSIPIATEYGSSD